MNISVSCATVLLRFRLMFLIPPMVLACQNTNLRNAGSISIPLPPTKLDGTYQAMIETGMGDFTRHTYNLTSKTIDTILPLDTTSFLPLPINLGFIAKEQDDQIIKIPTWVIGKRIDPGKTLSIVPLGLLQYEEAGKSIEVAVVVPQDPNLKTISAVKFQTFIIDYDSLKFSIEYWLRHRHGLGSISRLAWEDELKALEYLEE